MTSTLYPDAPPTNTELLEAKLKEVTLGNRGMKQLLILSIKILLRIILTPLRKHVLSKGMFLVPATMLLMSGCAVNGVASDNDVRRDSINTFCSWALSIDLSEASITALRNAQNTSPEVKGDRIAIAIHNRKYDEFCSTTID